MPTKASITTRTGKGSPLTTAEMDNNLTNLRDQSIAIADDTSTTLDVESGNTLTIAGSGTVSTAGSGQTLTITGSGISATSTDVLQNKTINTANNTITVAEADISDLGSYITATSTDTLTNKTFNVEGTGNSISNIDVADLKSGVLDTDIATVSASDDTLASAKAIKAYVDAEDANIASDSLTFTNKAGNISQWTNDSGYVTSAGIADVVSDTTPQLGGDLDVNGNDIVSVSDGNIVLAPNGTGKTKINNINYSEAAPHTVTYATTITPDVANGNIQKVTLTGGVTFSAFSNPVAGQTLTLFVVQDATGSRTLTSTMKFAGGAKTLSTAANAIDIITVHYDGSNYYANLVTNFS
ncbi:MAG: hypothetical protein K0U53_00170 [Betaproteobacteria bacterium]|nr:hypothetical protein [Betaproteobacteria bacterium]